MSPDDADGIANSEDLTGQLPKEQSNRVYPVCLHPSVPIFSIFKLP